MHQKFLIMKMEIAKPISNSVGVGWENTLLQDHLEGKRIPMVRAEYTCLLAASPELSLPPQFPIPSKAQPSYLGQTMIPMNVGATEFHLFRRGIQYCESTQQFTEELRMEH